MRDPILSVVMPCLNGMPHLPAAIESVRKTFASEPVEVIVADGGSTDGSRDYLRSTGVTLLEGADTSLYEGLNTGLTRTTSAHVAWLNSDDTMLDRMADLLAKARETDADLATGEAELETESGVGWRSEHHRREASIESLLFGIPSINSRIFSKRLLERAGPFRTDVGLGADRLMLIQMLGLSPRRTVLRDAVYRYRSHAGSRTIGATWQSYRRVHAAHLAMAEALGAESIPPADRNAIDAFACAYALAAARASLFGGDVSAGIGGAAAALARHPRPGRWVHGLRLHRAYRGVGSGW